MDHDLIFAMQQESEAWDKETGLNPALANLHSMAMPGQSVADAIQGRDNFVSTQLSLANWAWNSSKDYYWVNFTHAIHDLMDSTSPAHVDSNGNPYTWPSFPNALEHGDTPLVSRERWANMTPPLMQKNIALIRNAWTTMTGESMKCGCGK